MSFVAASAMDRDGYAVNKSREIVETSPREDDKPRTRETHNVQSHPDQGVKMDPDRQKETELCETAKESGLIVDTSMSGPKPAYKVEDMTEGGYFDLQNAHDEGDDGHSPSSPLSIRMPPTPSLTDMAFTALQYLPMPLLVLSSTKTIVLANEAMGRLLGLDLQQAANETPSDSDPDSGPRRRNSQDMLSATDLLYSVPMAVLGMDLLQNATPVWVSWNDFLESVKDDATAAFEAELTSGDGGDVTPTADSHSTFKGTTRRAPLTRANLARTTVHDVAVDVVFSTNRHSHSGLPKLTKTDGNKNAASNEIAGHIQSTVIISVWTVDDEQYYTLTFTSATDVQSSSATRTSHRTVARTQTSYSSGLGSGSSSSSNGRRTHGSHGSSRSSTTASPSVYPPALLPNGPPVLLSTGAAEPSLFSKSSRLKDALLNSLNDPAFAMWKDESFGIPNRAAIRMVFPEDDESITGVRDQRDFLAHYVLWKGDFSEKLPLDEFPIMHLMTKRAKFKNRRVGMYHPTTGAQILYDVDGETILDDRTGEFLGGLVIFHDVTVYANTIIAQQAQNERQFESITNMIPQMIWTTTPTGQHDYYNKRWYDYTGLTVEESLGEGWRNPFHPDDMILTGQR